MKQRGKKSAAELSIVKLERPRPAPPKELTPSEAAIWVMTVDTKPADWFTQDTHPLLVAYCRHVQMGEVLAAQVRTFEMDWVGVEGGLERLERLLRVRERETRAALALARSMRLTQQSRLRAETAATKADNTPSGPRPWDFGK
jgi:hypothetical protein